MKQMFGCNQRSCYLCSLSLLHLITREQKIEGRRRVVKILVVCLNDTK